MATQTTTPPPQGRLARLRPHALAATAWVTLTHRLHALRDDDRGDVPGWVLVTLMTAGLVTVLWALAKTTLGDVFSDALSDVAP
ncbi:hypothetical protein [Cellulomonas edaphi]|uniref:DUF4244 domain-containing protein n=1 Tax=Cellulomonas edaphi TaxID=3053468 RepID=A0ABT7SA20_9CELL|nr:hypothetical protein [Cellulomons edaphi]MDM7832470.1 hypothetical protein [Cellulomons edaphi]